MPNFDPGDTIRVDIPNQEDPDFDLHGKHAEVLEVLVDDASSVTGIKADGRLYRVEFEDGLIRDLRGRDIRPPINEERFNTK